MPILIKPFLFLIAFGQPKGVREGPGVMSNGDRPISDQYYPGGSIDWNLQQHHAI
jgi:hypothetical protein